MRPSPKHKFFAELNFLRPLRGLGSVVSYSGDDLCNLVSLLRSEARRYGVKASAVIRMKHAGEWLTITTMSAADLNK